MFDAKLAVVLALFGRFWSLNILGCCEVGRQGPDRSLIRALQIAEDVER